MGEHFLAQDLFLQLLEDVLGIDFTLNFAFRQRRHEVVEQLVDAVVIFELAADAHRFRQRHEYLLFHFAVEIVANLFPGDHGLLRADLAGQIVDRCDDLLDGRVRRFERLDDLLLGDLFRSGLDHHEAVGAPRDHEIDQTVLALLERRVDDVLAVHQAHAHAGNRLLEGDFRNGQRRRRAGQRQHIGVVLRVG